MNFNHKELLERVLAILPYFLKTEQIDWPEKTKGTKEQWSKNMRMTKSENCGALCFDSQILQLISHFLNRHIIIYPVFPSPDDSFIIPPSQDKRPGKPSEALNISTFEPFYLLLYSDVPTATQHYLSIRPRSEQITFKIPSPPPLTKAPAVSPEKDSKVSGIATSTISKEVDTKKNKNSPLKRQISNDIEEVTEFKKKLRYASGSASTAPKKDFFWANWDFENIYKACNR